MPKKPNCGWQQRELCAPSGKRSRSDYLRNAYCDGPGNSCLDKTELDALRVRRECAEILAELPEDFTELEAKEALEPTVEEACIELEYRTSRQQRSGGL